MLDRLREVLDQEGYSDEGLAGVLGGTPGFGLGGFDLQLIARRAPTGALGDLVTLFLLGGGVRRRRLERLLGKKPLAELERERILAGGDELCARIAIHVWGPLLLACDRHDTADRQDHVVGMTAAAATLAHLTVRPAHGAALDLGTGCGVGAVLAAAQGSTVTATDFNPHATELARITARLNGVRLELLEGDWFAPVDGRRFDLIVSNPPFVISPDITFTYRDGAEGVSEHVVRECAAHLADGGFATVLCNWVGADAPLDWARDTGCDAIFLRYGLDDPVSYAASWNHHLRPDPAAFETTVERWTQHYRALGAEAIASGAVVLHRSGSERAVAFDAVESPSGPAEAQLRRMFEALDTADRPYRLADGVVLEQTHVHDGRGLRSEGGLVYGPAGVGAEVSPATVARLLAEEPLSMDMDGLPGLIARGLVG